MADGHLRCRCLPGSHSVPALPAACTSDAVRLCAVRRPISGLRRHGLPRRRTRAHVVIAQQRQARRGARRRDRDRSQPVEAISPADAHFTRAQPLGLGARRARRLHEPADSLCARLQHARRHAKGSENLRLRHRRLLLGRHRPPAQHCLLCRRDARDVAQRDSATLPHVGALLDRRGLHFPVGRPQR
jgi:hypothetical protein